MGLAPFPSDGLLTEAHRHLDRLVRLPSWSLAADDATACAHAVADLFGEVADEVSLVPVADLEVVDDRGEVGRRALGPVVRAVRRPRAPRRVLLVGHYDTVFGPSSGFTAPFVDGPVVRGPGVVDAKGGLVVAWLGLLGFEADPDPELGWELLVVGDEEIGSPGSSELLASAARGAEVGLGYEPSMPDGSLAGARPGSLNLAHVVRGRAAHAGREHHLGRNAVVAAARLVAALADLSDPPALLTNPGMVSGGTATNIVPDLAVVRSNARPVDPEAEAEFLDALTEIEIVVGSDGITVDRHVTSHRPPKPLTGAYRHLLDATVAVAGELGMATRWVASGGVCDGNVLAGAGLVNVDNLGPVGGDLHQTTEYLDPDSLGPRARLTTELLRRVADRTLAAPS